MFKNTRWLLLLLLINCFTIVPSRAMELSREELAKRKPETASSEADLLKRPKLDDAKTLKSLPRDLVVKIVTEAENPGQAVKTIKSLMRTDKYFYNFFNNDQTNKAVIVSLARRFFHHDQFQAAKVLNTVASRAWITTAINPDIEKRLQAIMTENEKDIGNQNLSSIRAFLQSTEAGASQTIGETFFSSSWARIWLIKKLLDYTPNKLEMLSTISQKLFPDMMGDPELHEWITFTQKNLNSKIGDLVHDGEVKTLERLTNEGIDISQNLITGIPYIFRAKDAPTLGLLISAGTDVNAIQPASGNSPLHLVISEISDRSIVEGTTLDNLKNRDVAKRLRLLLNAGANPNKKNARQETPLMLIKEKIKLAKRYRNADDIFLDSILQMLKKYGAVE